MYTVNTTYSIYIKHIVFHVECRYRPASQKIAVFLVKSKKFGQAVSTIRISCMYCRSCLEK